MTAWIAETLVATSLLMLIVLALRDVVAKHFGPRAVYLLWLAPALRMVMPPLPPGSWGDAAMPVQSVMVALEGASSLSFQPTIAGEGGSALWMMLAIIWGGGAALFFLWHIARYAAFSRQVMNGVQPLFDQGGISIAASPYVTSPIAFGIFGRVVVVPADFEHRFNAVERRLAIAHEVTHHARRDLWINLGALTILALHWFNPLAHIAHRAFRLDQEAACDEVVLRGASADERHAYGSALFKSATGGVPLAVCAMGTGTQLKVRLRRIIAGSGRSGGPVVAALVVGAGLMATASVGAVAEAIPTVIAQPQMIVLGGGMINTAVPVAAPAPQQPKPVAAKPVRFATVSTAPPTPPTPPTPPVAPAVPVETAAPSVPPAPPVAPAPPRVALAACRSGSLQQIVTTAEHMRDSDPRSVTLVICHQRINLKTRGLIDALNHARAVIAAEPALEDAQRADVLASLDAQIARLRPLASSF